MKDFLQTARTILVTAWYGALTIFCAVIFLIVFFGFVDKVLDNNLFQTVILASELVAVTIFTGWIVRRRR